MIKEHKRNFLIAVPIIIVLLLLLLILILTLNRKPSGEPQNLSGETSSIGSDTSKNNESQSIGADLEFTPDEGIRVRDASNPGIKYNKDGSIALLYEDRTSDKPSHKVSNSSDGLLFDEGKSVNNADLFRSVKLPDNTYKAYTWDNITGELTSMSSKDDVSFTNDPGLCYKMQEIDNGRTGVYDVFPAPDGTVVLLYIGDLSGKNNVRIAYSQDNGKTFQFGGTNVFGDDNAGGGGRTYVDQKSVILPDKSIRMFVMKMGILYSFISKDGKEYKLEPGIRLQPSDFPGMDIVSLHDPQILMLQDGRYRIYVTAISSKNGQVGQPGPDDKQFIVSATSKGIN